MNEQDYRHWSQVSERSRQETMRENEIHGKHVSGWMYKGEPYSDCPCVGCYKMRRVLSPALLLQLSTPGGAR